MTGIVILIFIIVFLVFIAVHKEAYDNGLWNHPTAENLEDVIWHYCKAIFVSIVFSFIAIALLNLLHDVAN